MTAQGTAFTGEPGIGRRVDRWWIARATVLAAIGACAIANWLDPGASSTYRTTYGTSLGLGMTATFVAALFVLINGPQPRWATRWGWFWLILNPALVVTLPLFLLASGPLRPTDHPEPPTGRRLTGGWAFLLAVIVLGSIKVRL
ncbi:hypothetical protein [Flexivirga oryzae]|uniref:Uncharacterized protein n=1 Tax=Flexivirga oryzae TaxID=1794944 RepID=A0A839N9V6_9MICO|nr:hypothetical protein [Flexivirga oryzae]MBB2892973.1 hypothetical protein [Flexivirga oryzae]